jgi:hypothetical protein
MNGISSRCIRLRRTSRSGALLLVTLAGFWIGPALAGSRPAVPVRIYEWTGPHGVTHFSGTPPPQNRTGVTHLRQKTLELVPVSARQARRDYRASLRAARSMEQGLQTLEREEAVSSSTVVPPPYPENGAAVAPTGYVGQRGAFYPPLGFYPVGLGPPPIVRSPQPAPDLSPPSAGFGICGYEISCPGTDTPPVIGTQSPFFPRPAPAPAPLQPTAPPPPPPPPPPRR